jgi:hypothetical protein
MHMRTATTAPAEIICAFDTFKRLSTIAPCAAAGQSLTINAIDSRIDLGAITPPPRRPHEPPGLPESELPTNWRRHSSNISMRQVGSDRALRSYFCFAFAWARGMQQESLLGLLERGMEPDVGELLRMKRFDALATLVKDRWGIAPTTNLLQWLHEIALLSPKPSVGCSADRSARYAQGLIECGSGCVR